MMGKPGGLSIRLEYLKSDDQLCVFVAIKERKGKGRSVQPWR